MGNGEKGKLKEFGNDQERGNQAREGEEWGRKGKEKINGAKGKTGEEKGKGCSYYGPVGGAGKDKKAREVK